MFSGGSEGALLSFIGAYETPSLIKVVHGYYFFLISKILKKDLTWISLERLPQTKLMKMCPYAVLASERENSLLDVSSKPLLLCLTLSFSTILNPVASNHMSSFIWFSNSRMTFLLNFVLYISLEKEIFFCCCSHAHLFLYLRNKHLLVFFCANDIVPGTMNNRSVPLPSRGSPSIAGAR